MEQNKSNSSDTKSGRTKISKSKSTTTKRINLSNSVTTSFQLGQRKKWTSIKRNLTMRRHINEVVTKRRSIKEVVTRSIINQKEEALCKSKNHNGSLNQLLLKVSTGEKEELKLRFKKLISVETHLSSKLLMSYRWLIKLEQVLPLNFHINRWSIATKELTSVMMSSQPKIHIHTLLEWVLLPQMLIHSSVKNKFANQTFHSWLRLVSLRLIILTKNPIIQFTHSN